jgi:EmrB/QacA subfamily drug resistance transporter
VTETATLLAYRRRWLILGIILFGAFMAILDVFIVTQALPSINTTLGAGSADLELVVSAYSLVYAVFLVTGGRLGDILDRKRIFLFGMTIFTVASGLAGAAPTPIFLIGARALQGLGAALMYPQVLSIIQVTFKGQERALALGLFAAVSGIGAIAGNILGGFLIQFNLGGLSWRPIFLVNVPIGIVGILAGFIVLHPARAEHPPKLDLPGVALISLFLVSLVLPLAEGQATGWPTWTIVLLLFSLPLLAAFAFYEHHRTKNGEDPLVDMRLFKNRSFAIGIPLLILVYFGNSGLFFTLVQFLQTGLGYSPITSGLAFVQINVGFITASLLGSRLARRTGRNVLSIGYGLVILGLAWTLSSVYSYGTSLTIYDLTAPLVIVGLGAGFVFPPLLTAVLSGVQTADTGAASGVVSTSMQVGNTIGISIFGLLFYSYLGNPFSASPLTYLNAFKLTLPFFIAVYFTNFLLVFLLPRPRTVREIINRLE